jgi:Tfp pilus assembly protein PilN
MAIAAQVYLENPEETENFTIYRRPPAFAKRPTGKLFGYIAAALVLTLAWPGYQLVHGLKFNYETRILKDKYRVIKQENDQIASKLTALEREKKSLEEKRKTQKERLDFRKKLLNEIHDKKASYPMKGAIIHNLATLINNRGVNVKQIQIQENELILSLMSRNEKRLTELLKDISQSGDYSVATEEISKVENSIFYSSNVSVKVK